MSACCQPFVTFQRFNFLTRFPPAILVNAPDLVSWSPCIFRVYPGSEQAEVDRHFDRGGYACAADGLGKEFPPPHRR